MSSQKPVDPIDPRLIRKLADILKETELTEIEVEQGELKIRVARTLTAAPVAAPLTTYAAQVAAPAPVAAPAAAAPVAAPAAAEAPKAAKDALKSPMVGTVYLSPQPGAATFVKVGDKVKAGQTLLIIEAMKTMNPIPAPKDGTVSEILVSDAQPVEFGEGLVVID
ncbi:acetyl-CoA carboxylase biotin carboxyl carrier protein [Asticcacaulis excentricus]|jgi:acetyl-CoA carboxylase biotin carboxyl carrier protein|uniref:Biotin carboxyl carrier protein of acetyl-CoA carboxylase n=1 Tax=Asticcacaulis excentricus TaxID=78587 RepID=A0A3G9GAG5_9CAUL|nr:acetyl-CoA carboxylase biotin carboxyl carrier protein [Asticcacaulis excentricus]BBF82343.1 biotin carboxyl carrier protein of acetyl-CoA carboxylase [Asticcacaulis excentricus]